VTRFGARGDGVADDHPAISRALANARQYSQPTILLFPPGKVYLSHSSVNFDVRGLIVEAANATIRSTVSHSGPSLRFGGYGMRVRGLHILMSGSPSAHCEVTGEQVTLDSCVIEKPEGSAGIPLYVRESADGFTLQNSEIKGSNGIGYMGASNSSFLHNRFIGRKAGGDDAIAIKGHVNSPRNIRIIGNHFENLAAFCSIGSQVGVARRNDPARSRQVSGVQVLDNTGVNCANMVYIKPGAIAGEDYRDGVVENVEISRNSLQDLSGSHFNRGIVITPARGQIVRNVFGKGNKVIARAAESGVRKVGSLHLWCVDHRKVSPTASEPLIEGIDVELSFDDPRDGAQQGAAPGKPVDNFVLIHKQSDSHGVIRNVLVDLVGNGCRFSGIVVGPKLDDAVRIRRAWMTNAATNGSAAYAGIQTFSRIAVSDDISIKGSPAYRIEQGGAVISTG
jgi:hypothetical protein